MENNTDPISVTPNDHNHWLEMRTKNLNSTEISALFGANQYLSEYELWHKKKDPTLDTLKDNERMMWGRKLESVIAEAAAETLGLQIEPFKDYWYIPKYRIGSSFDYIQAPINGVYSTLLECKNVDAMAFNKNWIEHSSEVDSQGFSNIEAPPYIEFQVQHQMLVSGFSTCLLCVLVGGNQLKITKRDCDLDLQELILKKASKFWRSIEDNKPPKIDYEKDSQFIIKLYNHAEPNKTIEATFDIDALVSAYNSTSKAIKEFESQKEMYKAQILENIGDAEKVRGQKYSISAGITPEAQVSYLRKSFRNFKINNKKEEEV